MILGKLWRTIQAQLHKLAGFFWAPDPIAAMQYEYDRAVAQLREGRLGLAEYRAFVERVGRQVARNTATVNRLEATVKTCLQQGDREMAGRYVLELNRAREELAENQAQLQLHEQAYENNLLKIKHAGGNLARIRDKIARYDADLKMSSAEAEMARLAQEFHVDATTDFGKLESVIQERIDLNRAKVRVAVDLSAEGTESIRQEEAARGQLAEDALQEFERRMGTTAATSQASQLEQAPTTPAVKTRVIEQP
jgi:phage shock protein A